MKNTLLILITIFTSGFLYAQPAGLVINEFSQGNGGTKEFMEFVVIGQRTCSDSTVDLRGWIIDDHNGWYTGAGSAPGSIRLSNSSNWANVPIGSIILIYNSGDKNGNITQADDPTDANNDMVYILPVGNSYLESNSQPPSGGGGASFSYPTSGWGGGGSWSSLGLNNAGDAVISVDPTSPGLAFHSIVYNYSPGSGQTPVIGISQNVPANRNCYLTNGAYTSATAYSIGNAGTSQETPGAPNITANAVWINSLRSPSGGGAASRDTISQSICQGSSYMFNGNIYNTSGYYTATFSHSSGCDSVVVLNLTVTLGLLTSIAFNDVSCNGGNNGSAIATVTGGMLPYSYIWNTNPVQNSNIATNLFPGTYQLIVTDDNGCFDTAEVTISEPSEITMTAKENKKTCPETGNGIAMAIATGGVPPYQYSWTTSPQQNSPTATGLEEGVYTVTVTDKNGCTKTTTVSITPYPVSPVKVYANKTVICEGSTVQLSASGMNQYTWSPPTGLSCIDCANPFATVNSAINYRVIGTDTNGCKDTNNIQLNIQEYTPVSVEQDIEICMGSTAQLEATKGDFTYTWDPAQYLNNSAIANPVAKPDSSIQFRVIISQNDCFKDTLYQSVIVHPKPTVDLGPDLKAFPGTELQLNAQTTGASTIEWSPSEGLSCTFCPDPYLRLTKTITYRVTAGGLNKCTATDLITITASCDGIELYLPNTFTPNGDGQNDYFYPQGEGLGFIKRFKIMNSWGQVVFQAANISANNPLAGWDGRFAGQALTSDVFVYMLELQCSEDEIKTITGDITLIR